MSANRLPWRTTLKQPRKNLGFTLVEMLVVIVVIALLAAGNLLASWPAAAAARSRPWFSIKGL